MKTNLPGVSSSQMEERIIWLSIVGVNERGLATDSLRFSSFFIFKPGFGSISAQASV